jgi:hypothetical protein
MMPALGAQVDRMGRPAINTAANNTFNTNAVAADAAKDAYNAAPSTKWPGPTEGVAPRSDL